MFVSSLVILAASVVEISCGGKEIKTLTDKRTDKHVNAAEHATHATAVGVCKDDAALT